MDNRGDCKIKSLNVLKTLQVKIQSPCGTVLVFGIEWQEVILLVEFKNFRSVVCVYSDKTATCPVVHCKELFYNI